MAVTDQVRGTDFMGRTQAQHLKLIIVVKTFRSAPRETLTIEVNSSSISQVGLTVVEKSRIYS
jgi:hypothetical protein